jgi:hypothetical protein
LDALADTAAPTMVQMATVPKPARTTSDNAIGDLTR